MDGGRVLRAVLATRLGRARATAIAGRVGEACGTLPVLDGERLVGLLTMENISEVVMVNSALNKSRYNPAFGRTASMREA